MYTAFDSLFSTRVAGGLRSHPDEVKQLATDWTVRGSNRDGGEVTCIRPDRPGGPPSFHAMGTGSFSGV